jgi:hypothetical protein
MAQLAQAVPVAVNDSSFEDLVREPMADPFAPRNWEIFSSGGQAGRATLDPPLPGQTGTDIAFLDKDLDGGFAVAFLDSTVIEEGTYELTVDLAHQPGREPITAPFKINFEEVGFGTFTLLGSNPFPVGTANDESFTDVSASLNIPSGSSAIGHYLRLVLVTDDPEPGTDPLNPGGRYLLDNVRLTHTPAGGGAAKDVFVGESSFQRNGWFRTWTDGNSAGQYRPEAPIFINQSGDQLGFATMSDLGGHAGVFQDHGTIQAGTYTLTAGLGADPTAVPTTDSYLVLKFEAVDPGFKELIDEQSVITPTELSTTQLDDFSNVVVIEEDSPLIGRQLRSVIVAEGGEFSGSRTYLFDNVRIDFQPVGGLSADFNNDTFVNGTDLEAWESAFALTDAADADGDGDSDGNDFLEWQRQLTGGPAAPAVGALPEPATIVVAMAPIAILAASRRRRG